MKNNRHQFSRRAFLQKLGAAGVVSIMGSDVSAAMGSEIKEGAAGSLRVPKRPFGKSGTSVSILGLGGMFDIPNNQLLLRQALRWGVTYWDTADCYGRGRSEEGIGKYFSRYPEQRKDVFLVTKSDDRDPDGMTQLLERSLKRMETDYVDLYFLHGISGTDVLDDKVRRWSERKKAEGKIRLFGFSTHSNMEKCLMGAAKLGWIDGIMSSYNYRSMHHLEMKDAVEACAEAGIGLTAMKTQGGSFWSSFGGGGDEAKALMENFVEKGYTPEQAKLKAVWQNPQIASICSQMPSLTILKANVEAAKDPASLSEIDRGVLGRYADASKNRYCAGCSDICSAAVSGAVPVSDVLRYMMYARRVDDANHSVSLYRQLPESVRDAMNKMDFREAERRCPQGIAIGDAMREAVALFEG